MKTAIALGTFDGVHTAHRAIIDAAKKRAESLALKPAIYTFTGHPMKLFAKQPPLLMSEQGRMDKLASLGCELYADDFTNELAATEPEAFIAMLMERFDMACAVAGFNYSFGRFGRGDVDLLNKLGTRLGFDVVIVPPVMYKNEPVSSTRIRACLENGDVSSAGAMLGEPYSIEGDVVRNRGIGHKLSYPTANISGWAGRAIPAAGVYATRAVLEGRPLFAVTNIGCNPTVRGTETSIETHIMDFDADIYGKKLKVEFIERLRGEIRFPNVHALSIQMKLDGEKALGILKKA